MGLFDAPQTSTTGSSTTLTGMTPYPGVKKGLDTGLSDLLSMYKNKTLNPYTMTSTLTRGGLEGQRRNAVNSISPLNESLRKFRGISNGLLDVSSQGQMGIRNAALGPSYAERNLSDIASGKLIGQGDPNYERLRQRAMENASTEASMMASGLGRTGSDFHQTEVAGKVGDTVAGMDYQRLQDERARQVEANSLMDQMRQAGLGLGLNAQNSASAIQGSNQDRRYNANAAIPSAVDATADPYKTITDIGRVQDVDAAAKAGTGSANLQSLLQALGYGQPYGGTLSKTTSSGKTTEPDNKLGGLLGGGLGLASLLFG